MGERRPRRPTGIPRRTLDRSKQFVIAYVGTRWEVVGEVTGLDRSGPAGQVATVAPWSNPAPDADSAGAEGPSTSAPPQGRHAAS